jgi:NitT/TauT family transport system permease protein
MEAGVVRVTAVTDQVARPAAAGFFSGENRPIRLMQLAGLTAFLIVWQVAGTLDPRFLSSPTRVVAELGELLFEDDIISLVAISMSALLIGLSVSLGIGLVVGLLIGRYRTIQVMLDPYLAAYYSVPRIAFVPLMVIWFGINREFVVASVIFASSVLLIYAVAAGVREAGLAYYELARTFQLSERQTFTKILLPGSVPFIATGMRLAAQRALVAVIVAEFLVGLAGVGQVLREARVTLATDRLFATAIVTMIMGIAIVALTGFVERKLSRWRPQIF